MRSRYNWYIDPDDAEIERVWSSGVLTVDANVLLDLYRYHDQTREKLLEALESFSGRAWLSSQGAEEFVRNRKLVIASAAKTFSQADESLGDLLGNVSKAVDKLRGYRLISRDVAEVLQTEIQAAIEKAKNSICKSKDGYPNYLGSDPILERIFALFDGSIGLPPSDEDLVILHEEAKRRVESQVPPGYLDSGKDGDGTYGDYLLWREVLSIARERSVPVILVTSERKEDWWEKHSGRTVGPRLELLREAHSVSGQRVLIYQTDFFLQRYSDRAGSSVDAEVVEEIRSIRSVSEYTPAVDVIHDPVVSSTDYSEGYLTIHLSRPVYAATGSGRLKPNMRQPPKVWAKLVQSPEDAPQTRIGAATGTPFDFNIHIKSVEYGVPLPVGTYIFEYRALIPNEAPISSPAKDGDAQADAIG